MSQSDTQQGKESQENKNKKDKKDKKELFIERGQHNGTKYYEEAGTEVHEGRDEMKGKGNSQSSTYEEE